MDEYELLENMLQPNHDAQNIVSQAIKLLDKWLGRKWFEATWDWFAISGLNQCLGYLNRFASPEELGKVELEDDALAAVPYDLGQRLTAVHIILQEALEALHSNVALTEVQAKLAKILAEDAQIRTQLESFTFDPETARVDCMYACSENCVTAAFIAVTAKSSLNQRLADKEWNQSTLISYLTVLGEAHRSRMQAGGIQLSVSELAVAAAMMRYVSQIMIRAATAD
jgi:hypothetical protein